MYMQYLIKVTTILLNPYIGNSHVIMHYSQKTKFSYARQNSIQ